MEQYTHFAVQQTMQLLSIDSPTGYTKNVTDYLLNTLTDLGFEPVRNRKGSVCCTLGGEGAPLALAAHVDTLGLMVSAIKGNGRLSFTKLGGPSLNAVETENVTVITREGKRYTGVIAMQNASVHVNRELEDGKRDEKHLEVLLDELVATKEDVEKLGIAAGDIICLHPRAHVTPGGFIRSRFLDDKLSAGMLLALLGKDSMEKAVRKMYIPVLLRQLVTDQSILSGVNRQRAEIERTIISALADPRNGFSARLTASLARSLGTQLESMARGAEMSICA